LDECAPWLSRQQAPLVQPADGLTKEEIRRYSRHLVLPDVGMEGQRRLKNARVACVGAGGLGSPIAMYLAAAGIGTLGIVEFDVVDESNLQRQVIHGTKDIGRSKLDSARERIADLNPFVAVEPHEARLTSDNALEILSRYDLVVDGSDNFPTRYLVNDACVLLDKPCVWGAIFRFHGQVSVFWAAHGPCYRCLFPEPPPPDTVPSCAEGGVLGVVAATIGSLQATETIKVLLGRGDALIGRLLIYDALPVRFHEIALRKDRACAICGENRTIASLIDYEGFCGMRQRPALPDIGEAALSVEEMKARLDAGEDLYLLDVRERIEWEIGHIRGAHLIPLGELAQRLSELPRDRPIVAYCRAGLRSAQALAVLRSAGFDEPCHLGGGIDSWSKRVDPSVLVC